MTQDAISIISQRVQLAMLADKRMITMELIGVKSYLRGCFNYKKAAVALDFFVKCEQDSEKDSAIDFQI